MDTNDVARTASRFKQDVMSPGMSDLIQTIFAGFPRELDPKITERVSGGKREFGKQFRLFLENYPRVLNDSVLEKALVPPFDPATAVKLIRAGWSLACCVPGEVLVAAQEAVAMTSVCSRDELSIRTALRDDFERKPARWLAWYPPKPLLPDSIGMESERVVEALDALSLAIREFGCVKATIPSFGEACFLLGHSLHDGLKLDERIPLFHTSTKNESGSGSLTVWMIPPDDDEDLITPRLHTKDTRSWSNNILWYSGGSLELGVFRCLTLDSKK